MKPPDSSRLPELEQVPKSAVFLETVTVLSLVVAVLALFLFAWLADNVVHDRTRNFDQRIRAEIHQHASPAVTRWMIAVSFMGGPGLIAAAVLALLLFVYFRWRRAALWLVVTLAGTLVLELTLKSAFHRGRPVPFYVPLPITYSFPSGHALFSFCFYGVLAGLLAGRIRALSLRILIWALAALLVLAVGFSRVYLGVHYPSDVIAGYLAAAIWVATMVVLDRWRTRNRFAR